MSDLTKSCLIICLWAIVFVIGLIIAGEANKALGIVIMISSTSILLVKINAEDKLDKRQERLDRYVKRMSELIEEERRNDK